MFHLKQSHLIMIDIFKNRTGKYPSRQIKKLSLLTDRIIWQLKRYIIGKKLPHQIKNNNSIKSFKIELDDFRNNGKKKEVKKTYIYTYICCIKKTEKDIETRLTKAWTAINRLSIIWKFDLTDKMNHSFFQAAVTSILLYGCTTWTLTKRQEKKLDGNYTRMLRAIWNKSLQQHPTRHQLYGHLPPITKTI